MDDIAEVLAISKKTLYAHYSSKRALVKDTINHNFKNHERTISKILAEDLTALEKFMKIYEYGISFLISYHPSYYYDIKKYHRELSTEYEQRKNKMISDKFLGLLKQAQEDGDIIPQANLELFCKLYISEMDEHLATSSLSKKYPIHELLNHLIVFNLRGIATDPSKIAVH